MHTFSLDHLDETQFEELCFDLLKELGFINLKWRKGTGFSTSPADRGRDIECEYIRKDDVDGSFAVERWFVECKHHKKGVSAEKILNALTWATSEHPDVLLIIVSNFLSNPAVDHLEQYKKTKIPHFRIKVWQRKELEQRLRGKPELLTKYNIDVSKRSLLFLDPIHEGYISRSPYNTIDQLHQILNEIDDLDVLQWIVNTACSLMYTENDTRFTYSIDRIIRKCRTMAKHVDEGFVVYSVVSAILQKLFSEVNPIYLDNTRDVLNKITNKRKQSEYIAGRDLTEVMDELPTLARLHGDEETASFLEWSAELAAVIFEMPEIFEEQTKKSKVAYDYFCTNVVRWLLEQDALK